MGLQVGGVGTGGIEGSGSLGFTFLKVLGLASYSHPYINPKQKGDCIVSPTV